MGAMVESAWDTSRHDRPAMEPESSIKRVVSKVLRKEYGSSPPRLVCAAEARVAGAWAAGNSNDCGAVGVMGDGV